MRQFFGAIILHFDIPITRLNVAGRKPKGKLEPESGLLIKDMCCLNYCSSVNTTLGTELFCFPTDKEL